MASTNVLTAQRAERLRDMMAQWWAGWPLSQIGRAHGVTYQRAHMLLKSVGCTARRRAAHVDAAQKHERHPNRNEVIEAKVIMEGVAWPRLTVKQRAVVAWLASGLGTTAIAARTGCSQSSVRNLFEAARWRVLGEQARKQNDSNSPVAESFTGQQKRPDGAIESPIAAPVVVEQSVAQAVPSVAVCDAPEESAAPLIEFDEPDEREAEAVPIVDDCPAPSPEISDADLGPPASPSPMERKPIRLSDLRPKKPVRWVKLWSSNEHWPW